MSGVPRISAFSLSCACSRNVTAISPVSVGEDVVELLVARRDPRVELRGASARRTAGRSRGARRRPRCRRGRAAAAARPRAAGTRSSRSSRRRRARCVATPARTASAACCSDAVGLAPPMCTVVARRRSSMPRLAASSSLRRVAGRRDDAVDVGDREAGVGDRGGRGSSISSTGRPVGAAHVVGLTDADDRRARSAKPSTSAG